MININTKVKERLTKGIKRFQPILAKARDADINESDTVTIITDMFCEIFGYDKYENVTSEFAIKKTYCDLAIKLNGTVRLLVECKAAGLELKQDYIRQATDYAANSGIEWVALTNGVKWEIYKVLFTKPVDKQLVYNFNFCEISAKKQTDLEMLYYLCVEAFSKQNHSALDALHAQKQVVNKFIIGQLILTDYILESLKKITKKLFAGVKVSNEELVILLENEVLKREIIDGDLATEAKKKIQKAEKVLVPKTTPKLVE